MEEQEAHYQKLKQEYGDFERYLLKKGKLLSKDTGVGYWGVTPLDSLFTLFKNIKLHQHKRFLDLGSGDGRVVLLAALFDIKEAHGIEYDGWLVDSALHIKRKLNMLSHKKAKFHKDDFRQHDLSSYDLIYISPDQPFHRNMLETKLLHELRGRLIVHGYEFHPKSLAKKAEQLIDGEKFCIYELA